MRQCNRCKIFDRIVGHLILQKLRKPMGAAVDEHGITIRRRFGDYVSRDNATRPIVYYHRLAQTSGEPRRDQTRQEIAATSKFRGDYADRPARISLSEPVEAVWPYACPN